MIEYKKGDLFSELNKEDIYLQANNAVGNWGAGVAVAFRKNFPGAYEQHKKINNKVGMGYVLEDDGYKVGCLITSRLYGRQKDPPIQIAINTYTSLLNLYRNLEKDTVIQAPKINSGYFAVPWEFTEWIINEVGSFFPSKNIKWVVWEY
jgi:ADP-ribose 1''-phosphate phosphatase